MHNKIPSRVQIYGMASEFLFRETEELWDTAKLPWINHRHE